MTSAPGGRAVPVDVSNTWQTELSRAITSVPELLAAVGLEAGFAGLPASIETGFPLRVPLGYVGRMRRKDPNDPLLRQVLPLAAEAESVPGFSPDPVGDLASMRSHGLLHKYQGRALLIATGACAVHCRYCFRRHFPYGQAALLPRYIDEALAEIDADRSIEEVILSGGDPLSLSNDRLHDLLDRLGRIGHLTRVRFHTRQPVVLPERVDRGLCDVLEHSPRPTVFVIHCNHANELDGQVAAALSRLGRSTTRLLNQSVLLSRVNDSATTLVELSNRLFECGVLPYYLHQLDAVAGAAHFAVADDTARDILDEMTARLPGYLVPKLVREIPGDVAKRRV